MHNILIDYDVQYDTNDSGYINNQIVESDYGEDDSRLISQNLGFITNNIYI